MKIEVGVNGNTWLVDWVDWKVEMYFNEHGKYPEQSLIDEWDKQVEEIMKKKLA